MTYTTRYEGQLLIEPPLNRWEVKALTAFFRGRRIRTLGGPLDSRCLPSGHPEVVDYNKPPEGQPSLHCDLEVSKDGAFMRWGGDSDSGSDLDKWITYVIDHLLKEDAEFNIRERNFDLTGLSDEDPLRYFSFDHYVNGILEAEAPEGDTWKIYVIDNEVSVVRPPVFTPMDTTTGTDPDDDEGEEE